MKVHGNDPLARLEEILGQHRAGHSRPVRSGTSAAPSDRVELSSAAHEFHRVREAALREPDVRTDLVQGLRQRIASSEYTPDARTVARKVLEDLGGVPAA